MATDNANQMDDEVKGILAISVIIGGVWWLAIEILFFVIDFHPGTGLTRLLVSVIFFAVVFTFISHAEEVSSSSQTNDSRQRAPTSTSQGASTTREPRATQSPSQPSRTISDLSDAIQISNHVGNRSSGWDTLKEKLQSMDEYAFENLVAGLWENVGWDTSVTSGSGDRGIDVVATRTGMTTEKHAIQAKRYSEGNTVGSQDVRNYATLHQQEPDLDSVVIVTTSRFTKQATRLAKDLNVKLVDGDGLCKRISHLAEQEEAKSSGESTESERSRRRLTFYEALDKIEENKDNLLIEEGEDYLEFLIKFFNSDEVTEEDRIRREKELFVVIENEQKRLNNLVNIQIPNEYERVNKSLSDYIEICHVLIEIFRDHLTDASTEEELKEGVSMIDGATDEFGERQTTFFQTLLNRRRTIESEVKEEMTEEEIEEYNIT